MQTKIKRYIMLMLALTLVGGISFADTFTNKQTGESFTGFMTQKTTGAKTLVYNTDTKELTTINLADYEVERNSQGRKETVVVIPITQSEVLLSQVVSETIAEAIVSASNKGPQAILLQIDNPGGRGDYMKIITSAITQTDNCPVVAYITGKQYGGAFSAAAMIALSCDKVYISPTASIGAIAPYAGAAVSDEEFADYLATYASDSLASYSIYATALAHEHQRPPLLVRALVDKRLSVEEVRNTADQTLDYVQQDDRLPSQTRVRTLAEGLDDAATLEGVPQGQIVSAALNLPPTVAVEVGLVDKVVDSMNEILNDMNFRDAQLTTAGGVENAIKKYAAARRNIGEALARIQWLENRASILEEQMTEIERQLRTGSVTRQYSSGEPTPYRRSTTAFPDDYNRYYYDPGLISSGGVTNVGDPYNTRDRDNENRRRLREYTVVTQQPAASVEQVQRELLSVLNDLIIGYRRAMSQAKRWPGSLPPDLPLQALQQNTDSALALRDYLLRRPFNQQQFVSPPVMNQRRFR